MSSENPFNLPIYSFSDADPLRRLYYLREGYDDIQGWAKEALRGDTVIGLDIEWRPSFVKGHVPQPLQDLLRDSSILKVGVGIHGDVKKLREDWQVEVVNALDLSVLAKTIDPYWQELDTARRQLRKQKQQEQRDQRQQRQQRRQDQEDSIPAASSSSAIPISTPDPSTSVPVTLDTTTTSLIATPTPSQSAEQTVEDHRNSEGVSRATDTNNSNNKNTARKQRVKKTQVSANADTNAAGDGSRSKFLIGLKSLGIRYLSRYMQKSKKVQMGNWEAPLSDIMLEYAANDACIAYDIYQRLRKIQKGTDPLPTQPVV